MGGGGLKGEARQSARPSRPVERRGSPHRDAAVHASMPSSMLSGIYHAIRHLSCYQAFIMLSGINACLSTLIPC